MTKTCRHCHTPFTPRHGNTAHCSETCRNLEGFERRTRMCAFCGERVEGQHVCQVLEDHIAKQETG